ncbi:hypothetical protein F8568_013745 [Actinomadura sp. LD22]|uniref:Uncharacterized protein n=1 Tax=Actinomadura physcomitrii TaxID=2650748 RepID=A0A6I4MGU4_9ACTN|nr:hypothetical protein [Actinomadura physcomitrii]MWA01426.1 hypothetical protein [Actinomadura physcomitrii]
MSGSGLAASLASLSGVVVGAVIAAGGSYWTQRLLSRESTARARADRLAALRAERKEALREFMEAAQAMERASHRRFRDAPLDSDTGDVTHRFWYLQRCLDLLCSPELRTAARAYAERLDAALWHERPADGTHEDFLREARETFLQAARKELGIPELEEHA